MNALGLCNDNNVSPSLPHPVKMKALQVVFMTSKKILLIHKEPHMQEVVESCLTDFTDWNVQVVNSTLEGLQQAKTYQPDAIILEASVDERDGLLFFKKLRAHLATQKIPVLLLIVKAKWVDLKKSWFQQEQVAAVILNPVEPAMLSMQIANVLGWDLN